MADEIDIEEHDLLENPAIRSIFPDILVLKKELDCYSDDPKPVVTEEALHETFINCKVQDNPVTQNSTVLQHCNQEKQSTSRGNNFKMNPSNNTKIILGSKPPTDKLAKKKNNQILNSKVIVTDIGSYLKRSSRYCSHCKTLFLHRYLFQEHLNNKHLRTVTIQKQGNGKLNDYVSGMVKERTKASNIIGEESEKISSKLELEPSDGSKNGKKKESILTHSCFHCDQLFLSQKLLVEHLYTVLQTSNDSPGKQETPSEVKELSSEDVPKVVSKKNITNTKETLSTQSLNIKLRNKDDGSIKCDICNLSYASIGNLRRHMREVHGEMKTKTKYDTNKGVRSTKKLFKTKVPSKKTETRSKTYLNDALHKEISLKELKEQMSKRLAKRSNDSSAYYRCPLCSYYFKTKEYFDAHMFKKHQAKSWPLPTTVTFDPKCLYCGSKQSTPKVYNTHISHRHSKRVIRKAHLSHSKQIKDDGQVSAEKHLIPTPGKTGTKPCNGKSPILKSTLFMCSKCDIHFLNAKLTLCHKEHIEMLINWKCPKCCRIFKREDQTCHEKQHQYTNKFTVFELTGALTSLNKILFSCSKCTVHFDEISYLNHVGMCETETPKSSYCHVCDLLIDFSCKMTHDSCHSSLKLKPEDFTIVEADVLSDDDFSTLQSSPNIDSTKVGLQRQKVKKTLKNIKDGFQTKFKVKADEENNSYFFCETCKCFVGFNVPCDVHLEGLCVHLLRTLCKFCGIVLTPSGMKSHRKKHGKKKIFTLQNLKFYDFHTGKMVCPPMLKLPECESCHVQFMDKTRMRQHMCRDAEYLTCEICSEKISHEVINLHMAYHDYAINGKTVSNKITPSLSTNEEINMDVPSKDMQIVLYTCRNCRCTVDCYDKVIEHCQTHTVRNEDIFITKRCEECDLTFQQPCFDNHLFFHGEKTLLNVRNLEFDTTYFLSDEWLNHVFGSLSNEEVDKITKNSMYLKEKRVKMEILKEGLADLTVYQCSKCQYYVDPSSIYRHLKESCSVLRRYPCYMCGLTFNSLFSKRNHDSFHKNTNIDPKTFRILLFKKIESFRYDTDVSKQYVIYQCRNCYSAIDRCQKIYHKCNTTNLSKCEHCGLLINNEDINKHILIHKKISTYQQDNIKIVLFGEKLNSAVTSQLKPSFCGIICDYTLYQCSKCKICIKIIHFVSKHDCCIIDSCKTLCTICNLYFCTSNYKSHKLCHESDPDFLRDNMKVITFDLSNDAHTTVVEKKEKEQNRNIPIVSTIDKELSKSMTKEIQPLGSTEGKVKKIIKLYKCNCGLNFLNESDINIHIEECGSKQKISKQQCSKCELLFTPNILFNHLLNHHGNKKYTLVFDIIEMSKTVDK